MTQANEVSTGFNIDDLDNMKSEATLHTVAVILDAEGNDKSGFYIASKNCAEYQAEARAIRIESLQKSAKRKTSLDTTSVEGATVVAELIENNERRLALSVVKGWFGFNGGDGKAAPFSKDMTKKLFQKFPTWRESVTAALDVDSNFIKG